MKKMMTTLTMGFLLSNLLIGCGRYSQMPVDMGNSIYQNSFRRVNTFRSRGGTRFNSFSSSKQSSKRKNQFIIKFKNSPQRDSLDKYADYYQFKIIKTTTLGVLVEKLSEESDKEFMDKLKKHPKVDYVEKNSTYRINK